MRDEISYILAGLSDTECLDWKQLFMEWPPGTNSARLARLEDLRVQDIGRRAARHAEAKNNQAKVPTRAA
jgi:hypothetical protein